MTRLPNAAPAQKSLEAFMREKQCRACKICALPAEVRAQIGKVATDRGYSRDDQIAWLNEGLGHMINRVELDQHINRHHATETP